MTVGVKPVLGFGRAAGNVKSVLVEHQRDFMGIEPQPERGKMVGILAVEEVVPGIAGTGLLEKGGGAIGKELRFVRGPEIGNAAEDVGISELGGKNLIRPRKLVGESGQGLVAHERQ